MPQHLPLCSLDVRTIRTFLVTQCLRQVLSHNYLYQLQTRGYLQRTARFHDHAYQYCKPIQVKRLQRVSLIGRLFLIITHADPGAMDSSKAAVEYAVESAHVQHIIVLGHYGCKGVEDVITRPPTLSRLIRTWLDPITLLYQKTRRYGCDTTLTVGDSCSPLLSGKRLLSFVTFDYPNEVNRMVFRRRLLLTTVRRLLLHV
jgi:hypothetical protein